MIADDIKLDRTLVTFLLDRTGSMQEVRDDTIGAFNTYIETLKREGGGIEFSLILFDSTSVDRIYVNRPIAEVKPLTTDTYVPRDWTPLIDASFKTIKAVERSVSESKDKPKVVICIQTDGQENASRQHTMKELQDLIKEKRELGWQFNFMGCGIDAYDQARQMGISRGSTVSYGKDFAATQAVFSATARNTSSYAGGQSVNTNYSRRQKKMSGDPTAQAASINPDDDDKPIVEDFTL